MPSKHLAESEGIGQGKIGTAVLSVKPVSLLYALSLRYAGSMRNSGWLNPTASPLSTRISTIRPDFSA